MCRREETPVLIAIRPGMLLRYILHTDPRWYPQACYALDLLLEGIGLAGAPTDDPATADLVYAPTRPAGMVDGAVWIRAGNEADWTRPPVGVGWLDAMPVFYQGACPGPGSEAYNNIPADLLYATYALVGGVAEQQASRSGWGAIPSAWRLWERSGAAAYPVVALYVHYIATRLKRHFGASWAPVCRWPSGKEYAVVLTHAVGCTLMSQPPPSYYRRRWRVDIKRHAWERAVRDLGRLGRSYWHAWSRQPREEAPDAYVSSREARERAWGVTSCFYVAASGVGSSGLPVGYGAPRSALVGALRRAVEAGWEVGLQVPVDGRATPDHISEARQRLEAALGGYRVRGVRFGLEVLDRRASAAVWRTYAEAGFSYGTSAWLEDAPGSGHGMIWPFLPFDRSNASRFEPFHVLPAAAALDVPDASPEEAERRLRQHIARVFSYGGAVVLDGACGLPGHDAPEGRAYLAGRVMQDLLLDDRIFWTTPDGLAAWWRARRRSLAAVHEADTRSRKHGEAGRHIYPLGAAASPEQPPSAA